MLFSVIVPIYNVEQYLPRCLDSVLNQTFSDYEVILVDDGSTDGCLAICKDYEARDNRVRIIHKPNGGLISARNVGLFESKGDYILYVDGDDWTEPGMLEFVASILKESPVDLDMVLFAANEVYEDHIEATINNVPEGYYDKSRMQKEIYPYLLSDRRDGFHGGQDVFAHTWDKACKRELVLEHYARDERIRMFTDVAYIFECLLYSNHIYICNELLYNYNKTNVTSITAGKRIYIKENFTLLTAYLQERLAGCDPSIDRQLNDYPALLIIHDVIQEARIDSLHQTARIIRQRLNSSKLLERVRIKGLPLKPKIFIAFWKIHFDHLAVLMARKS